jgi:hypothetical protein
MNIKGIANIGMLGLPNFRPSIILLDIVVVVCSMI